MSRSVAEKSPASPRLIGWTRRFVPSTRTRSTRPARGAQTRQRVEPSGALVAPARPPPSVRLTPPAPRKSCAAQPYHGSVKVTEQIFYSGFRDHALSPRHFYPPASARRLRYKGVAIPPMRVWPGRPYPLGATWEGGGVNF